jgi:flagellar biosynthesis protein FlhB
MKIKIKIFVIFLLSLILSFIPSDDKTIITKDTLINSTLQLFGVTLAIIALLFTILDRYKANLENSQKLILEKKSFPILKNMGDDVLATLLLAVIIFFYDIFYIPLQWIQDFPFFYSSSSNLPTSCPRRSITQCIIYKVSFCGND